jgi:hypothetical protein
MEMNWIYFSGNVYRCCSFNKRGFKSEDRKKLTVVREVAVGSRQNAIGNQCHLVNAENPLNAEVS